MIKKYFIKATHIYPPRPPGTSVDNSAYGDVICNFKIACKDLNTGKVSSLDTENHRLEDLQKICDILNKKENEKKENEKKEKDQRPDYSFYMKDPTN